MEKLPIYELKINDSLNDDSEVSYVALVDNPAIQRDFLAFNEKFIEPSKGEHEDEFIPRCISYVVGEGKDQEQATAICYSIWDERFAKQNFQDTYNDYPKQASENAKIALRWAEENGWGDCGTSVGKARANQLANGENISRDTIARMAGFERHRQNSDKELGDGCGRLMWLAWGGDAGVEWASRKLQQIDKEKMSAQFQVVSEEEKIISGPLMLADQLIYRNNDQFGEHYVKFSSETIKAIAIKWSKRGNMAKVNLMHDSNKIVDGVTMFESFIVDKKRGIMPMVGFEDVADGSWFGSFYVENPKVWDKIKAGDLKGFSVEGMFDYESALSPEEEALNKIAKLLETNQETALIEISEVLKGIK
jgi:hypothetical protein